MLKLLFVSPVSACFEMVGDTPYYAPDVYDVLLNGEIIIKNKLENVFSLYDLVPDTQYTVSVNEDVVTFRTDAVSQTLNVVDFGAVADGVNYDTNAIQSAINACSAGGMVFVPKGDYKILPLSLKSDITLYLKDGAHLIAETDPKKYPIIPGYITDENGKEKPYSSWEGEIMPAYQSVLSGQSVKNVKIVGLGIIDGNAQNGPWWQKEFVFTRVTARPRVIYLNDCKNCYFHGVTAQNGATWNVHPFFSEDLGFYDLRINAPKNSPNTDGLNPDGCDRVEIIGCVFSTGDDCIAIKSGVRPLAEKYKRSANNYTIRNCFMRFGHGSVVLGSEASGGVKNLTVSHCYFKETDRGLRIKTRRNRGKLAVIDGIEFSNIKMSGVLTPFVVGMFYACGEEGKEEYVRSRKPYPVDDSTPYLGEFTFKNIDCVDCEVCAGYFDGLPERPIKKIVIENVSVAFKTDARKDMPEPATVDAPFLSRAGFYFDGVESAVLKNVKLINVDGQEIIRKNCDKIEVLQ